MGGSGGGQSTSASVDTPEVAALKQRAVREIGNMLDVNPLSNYAAWQPREIAGTNPAYEQLFQAAGGMGPAVNAMSYLFGPSQGQGQSPTVPFQQPTNVGAFSGIPMTATATQPAPPQQFQAANIQDIIQQQISQQVDPAVQAAVKGAQVWRPPTPFEVAQMGQAYWQGADPATGRLVTVEAGLGGQWG